MLYKGASAIQPSLCLGRLGQLTGFLIIYYTDAAVAACQCKIDLHLHGPFQGLFPLKGLLQLLPRIDLFIHKVTHRRGQLLIRASDGSMSCSGTPRRLARMSSGSNQQKLSVATRPALPPEPLPSIPCHSPATHTQTHTHASLHVNTHIHARTRTNTHPHIHTDTQWLAEWHSGELPQIVKCLILK